MESIKLLLNFPYDLTEADRENISRINPRIEIRTAPTELFEYPDRIAGDDVDVLVTEIVPNNLHRWSRLKFVQLVSAGIDHLANHPIWASRIAVSNASGIHSVPMAQFATGAVLALAHRAQEIIQFTSSRVWPNRNGLSGSIVRGQTVGVLGYGNVGRECARQLQSLGMRVVCLSRSGNRRAAGRFEAWPGTGDPDGVIPERWFTPQQLKEMLPLCDVLLVTSPRTQESAGMIGSQQLELLRPGAHVIVISRGGIVDEESLAAALYSGHVGGAWIDCFSQEPPPANHPLFGTPHTILTPHMSGVYDQYWVVLLRLLNENLRRFCNRQPLLNIASGTLGY